MARFHEEHKDDADSSDDDLQLLVKPQTLLGSECCSKSWYHRLLRQHDRNLRNGSTAPDATKGITLDDVVRRDQAVKDGWDWEVTLPSKTSRRTRTRSPRPPPTDRNLDEQVDSSLDELDTPPVGQKEKMFPTHDGREYKKFVGVKSDIPVE